MADTSPQLILTPRAKMVSERLRTSSLQVTPSSPRKVFTASMAPTNLANGSETGSNVWAVTSGKILVIQSLIFALNAPPANSGEVRPYSVVIKASYNSVIIASGSVENGKTVNLIKEPISCNGVSPSNPYIQLIFGSQGMSTSVQLQGTASFSGYETDPAATAPDYDTYHATTEIG